MQERAEAAEGEFNKLSGGTLDVEQLQKDLADRNTLIGKLRHDVIQYQTHLSEAMKRMNTEDGVDR
jgi:hypothetical protein